MSLLHRLANVLVSYFSLEIGAGISVHDVVKKQGRTAKACDLEIVNVKRISVRLHVRCSDSVKATNRIPGY